MKLSAPIPWRDVPTGAVVLWQGTPRTVLANDPIYPSHPGDSRVVLLEGAQTPPTVGGLSTVQLVELDETDAMINLLNAGLNPTVIKE